MDVTIDNFSEAKALILEKILPKVKKNISRLATLPTTWSSLVLGEEISSKEIVLMTYPLRNIRRYSWKYSA